MDSNNNAIIKMVITFHASFYANGGDSNTLVKFTEHEVGWKAPVYVDEVGGRTSLPRPYMPLPNRPSCRRLGRSLTQLLVSSSESAAGRGTTDLETDLNGHQCGVICHMSSVPTNENGDETRRDRNRLPSMHRFLAGIERKLLAAREQIQGGDIKGITTGS